MVITSLALVLFTSFCVAAPSPYTYPGLHRRQNAAADNSSAPVVLNNTFAGTPITVGVSNTTVSVNGTTSILVPVLPPSTDQTSFSILALDTQVTLAWAGGSQPSTGNLVKRAGSVYSQANLTFAYPVIPLDHSNYVSRVTCSGGQLTGTLSSAAYSYAKQQWAGTPDIVFVTSADGCGADAANDYFHAKSVTFTDGSMSFAANGSSAMLKNITSHMTIQLGNVGTTNVKRAIDKTVMFDAHPLEKRVGGRDDFTFQWGTFLNDEDLLGTDDDAPWENAALLAEWGSEGEEEDDSFEKGEVASSDGHHKKRSTNGTSLQERDTTLEYGLKLYCVECGFGGQADLWSYIDVGLDPFEDDFGLNTLQCGLDLSMVAGFALGFYAFVDYEKEWEKELGRIWLGGWSIPAIIDIGPFVSVSVQAKAGIEASGQLLLGANATWDGISVMLDVLHPGNSDVSFPAPTFQGIAEAEGEVQVSASLGLPIELGVGISLIDGWFEASAGIVDTPSIVAEGVFEVSASITSDGEIETDINGGCYGIAWDVHFQNELDAKLTCTGFDDVEIPLIEPEESDPIAQGCIGYVKDGTDDVDDSVTGTGSSTGLGGNGLNSGGNGLSGGDSPGGSGSSPSSISSSLISSSSSTSTSSSSAISSSSSTSSTSGSSTVKGAVLLVSSTTTPSISSPSSQPTPSPSAQASSKVTSSATTPTTSVTTPTSSSAPKSASSSPASSASTSSRSSLSTSTLNSQTTSKTTSVQSSSKSTSSAASSTTSSRSSSSVSQGSSSTSTLKTSTSSSQQILSAATKTSSSSSTTTSISKATSTCTRSTAALAATPTPSTATCSTTVTRASVPSATSVAIGSAATLGTVNLCAAKCLNATSCLSFSYGAAAGSCQLYNKAYKDLKVTSGGVSNAATLTFFDHGCFAYNTC